MIAIILLSLCVIGSICFLIMTGDIMAAVFILVVGGAFSVMGCVFVALLMQSNNPSVESTTHITPPVAINNYTTHKNIYRFKVDGKTVYMSDRIPAYIKNVSGPSTLQRMCQHTPRWVFPLNMGACYYTLNIGN